MNILFGFIVSAFILCGNAENCNESKELQSTCETYCLNVVKPNFDHIKQIQSEVNDFKQEPKNQCEFKEAQKLLEAKIDLLDKKIEQILQNSRLATEQTLLEQFQSENKKVEKKLEDLLKLAQTRNSIAQPSYQRLCSKYFSRRH